MRNGMNRTILPGTRLQGVRHGPPRSIIPVKRPDRPTQCVYPGIPEYPVEDIYADRESKQDNKQHEQRQSTIPVKESDRPTQCVYPGIPEYPVEAIYAGRKSEQDKK